ncbi:hypothetical protein LOTGIDRAFT_175105 [Lottia gigantea]|uniref:Uncharacterized protein n=1 Tax=Lottia gigantea TaxID=225164 RepID=V4C2A6_LOTGI|nr:hypothetical protein LOTGIDRAFT_175105 [Lottia gigantea]ESO95629.1 hypothetical protein LOTGIDRAFT_175105 [Lottia gigantea]
MQPLKTQKDSAPGISTWQHEFPSVNQSARRPKTAIGMKRAMFSRSYKYLNRPFTARTAPATRGSNQSERDSMMSSNETLSSHNISDNERKESQTTSKQAQFGESNESVGYSSEDTSDLGNSFNENDFVASRYRKTTKCGSKEDGDEALSEETRQGCQLVPTAPQVKQENDLLQPESQKSCYIKRPTTPKSPLLMTRRSYPLGNRDEPLNDDAMPSSRRPQTARPVRRGSIYGSQQRYSSDGSSVGTPRVRPKTAFPARKQSITSTTLSLNVVDMSPRSRPVTARTKDGRKQCHQKADTEDLPDTDSEATSGPKTNKVFTNSFPVRRRKSVSGNVSQQSSKDDDTGSPKSGMSCLEDGIEGECITPRNPTVSILRRPKSSLGHGFIRASPATSEINVVDMSEALDDPETAVKMQQRRSFKPLTRAIMALNQTRRLVVQNSSLSRSLETKGILLQHDDLSKTKSVTQDVVPVVPENPVMKTKTVITLEIPQI